MSNLAPAEAPTPPLVATEMSTMASSKAVSANTGSFSANEDQDNLSDVLPGGSTTNANAASDARREFIWQSWEIIKYGGWKVFLGMQTIGEIIASILGLNHSKYQWVIDNMTEEDWKIAREVHRRKEAARLNQPINDMEGAVAVTELQEAEKVER